MFSIVVLIQFSDSPTNIDVWVDTACVSQIGDISTLGTISAPNIYNISQVDALLASTQNSLNTISAQYLDRPLSCFSLLIGSNTIPRMSVASPLSLTLNGAIGLQIGLATSVFEEATLKNTTIEAKEPILK